VNNGPSISYHVWISILVVWHFKDNGVCVGYAELLTQNVSEIKNFTTCFKILGHLAKLAVYVLTLDC
jgi:hypothetical protein